MPTIQQLPSASSTSTTDEIPVSQSGTTRSVTVGALLAAAQPVITLPSTTLLGRNSLGPGGPEIIAPGIGLQLANGSLSADGADHADFPLETQLNVTDNVILDSDGTPSRLPLNALRDLFTAGNNVTIQGGTISAAANSDLGLPAAAPLLSSNGTTLTAVVLGSNLSLNAGTLSAASVGVAAPAAAALVSSTGTSLTGIALGANLSLAAGTLSATSLVAPAMSGLVSSTGSSLAPVTLAGASYAGGTLTVPSYTLPAASATGLGGVRAGANLTIAADGTISAPAPLAVPATAPLLASTAGSLATVALGNNLILSAGTLSATAPTVPTSAALLASTASGALANVALNGLSYAGGTLTAPGSSVATTAAAGVVKPDGSTISISPAGVISTTGTATISGASPVTPANATTTATTSTSIANLFGRTLYVEDFGAVGNGISSGTGGGMDDAPAIQAAINALGSRGGVIRFAAKTYRVASAINVTAAPIHFIGDTQFEGASAQSGTVISIDQTGFVPFTVGQAYTSSASFQPSGAAIGTHFENITFFQIQPAAAATPSYSTTLTAAASTTQTITVASTTNIAVGDTVTAGPAATATPITVTAISSSTSTVTLSAPITMASGATITFTVLTAWTPIAYPYVIEFLNLYGGFQLTNIFFLGCTNGVYSLTCGHMRFNSVDGQCFTNMIKTENCLDSPYFDFIRHWDYENGNLNIRTYMQANTKVLMFGRCDGFDVQRMFCFSVQAAIYCYQEAAVTGMANPNGNTPGGCGSGSVKLMSEDESMYGLWLDNLQPAGTSKLFQISIMNHNCISGPNYPAALTGGRALFINVTNYCIVHIASLSVYKTDTTAVVLQGDTNVLQIGTFEVLGGNFTHASPAPPIIDVMDNAGTRNPNRCQVASATILNGYGAQLFGSSTATTQATAAINPGNGIYHCLSVIYDGAAPVQSIASFATPILRVSNTVTAVAATALATIAAGAGTQLRLAPNLPAGGYANSVKSGDFVIVPDVGGAINTGGLVIGHSSLGYEWRYDNATGNHTIGGNRVVMPPLSLPNYALSNLPAASSYTGCYVDVTGYTATGVGPLARSDGTNWRFVANGAIVS